MERKDGRRTSIFLRDCFFIPSLLEDKQSLAMNEVMT